ncbi:pentatricopeptide repeat-containing protein, chloroplastic isoform X1 [Cinnamomum micranthum f. kanehirae]|uniref:Pentatricopeptide repeat-containing protein, chloroplastic isoform X1 n=1 Tax=Cinnamomum micranthum f. kanehirae TaxID=337451 RepID=A0A3S3NEB4_9MAGN|nr:pentatricopeptide repeat-containing protein, chloroplastic isoform X1 [Cinnamomum micranthum f. kanehirae]
METSISLSLSSQNPSPFQPNTEKIKRRLLKKGVFPTPKIVRTLQKKETLKLIRKSKRLEKPLPESQKLEMEDEAHFQTVAREYRTVMRAFKGDKNAPPALGLPWEGAKGIALRELASGNGEFGGDKLKGEGLVDLKEMLAERKSKDYRWLLDDDLEEEGFEEEQNLIKREKDFSPKRQIGDNERIRMLIDRLSTGNLSMSDWKFSRLMNQSGIQFTERNLLRIVGGLGARGHWRHALSIVEWEDYLIYPDMAAYHSIAVTLGQAGQLKELLNIVECMRQRPSKRIRNMRRKNWDRCLEPDVVLNACVSCQQWKGVPWVLGQMRRHGLKPNGATYGLAMEVMLKSGKYDLVHKFFGKMMGNGFAPKALTYKVLVRAFWEEGKVNEAIEAVKDMEQRGVVGSAGVYYELACCLCHNGRWQEAMVQVEKLKTLPLTKPLEVAFTGMIKSCMDGGHAYDCITIFESMKDHCTPNVGTINAMLKVYGRIDMFAKAKELFEEIKKIDTPDAYSYTLMLEVSASAHQWEYFEYVYKEMVLSGFQIDQNKHAWVLVEASRAVKWHLLEHAFDAILEAGEIPHLSLFTEMTCQNIARQEYERAVSIVNSMGHTSLQMSEKQWTDLFIRNQDRITAQKLMELSDTLCNSNIMKEEAIVSNFLKSLKCLCRLHPSKDSEVTALSDASAEGSGFCQSDGDVDATVGERLQQHSLINLATENHSFNRNFVDDDDDDDDDLIPSMFPFYNTDYSEDEDDNENRQSQNNVNSDYGSSELPSASEILEAWRESQVKDGIFPFQL